ncbi:MAG: calcium/sodium antiporter [Bacilli bacterium]|nr:calcium/sodium antiporter [Bacilli bacterium]
MEYFGLLLGIIIIIVGSEIFIEGIESTAINYKIPKMFIILTIVAFGTSTPEFIISLQGVFKGNGNLVLSNVIGSTAVNTLLIIGISSLINPIKVKSNTVKKELPLHLFIIVIFSILFMDSLFGSTTNTISRSDALLLLLAFFLFFQYLMYLIKNRRKFLEFLTEEKPKFTLKKSVILSAIGLFLIIGGCTIAVKFSTLVAESLGWSEKITTMIFLVIGTSIPELVMSIISARKKQYDFVIGNIVGTNIFNICIVIGLPVFLFGSISTQAFNIIDMIAIIISGVILLVMVKKDYTISKKEGFLMILIFLLYYTYLFMWT